MRSLQEDKSPFKLAYLGFKYGGIMNQEGRPWSLVYSTVFGLSCISIAVFSGVDLIWGDEELPELVAALSAFTISIHVNGKFFNMLRNQSEIRQLIDRIEKLRQEILQDNDRKHFILSADKFSIKVAFFYGIFFLSCPIFSVTSNIIIDIITDNKKPHLLLQMWSPWIITDVWTYLKTTAFVIVCIFPSFPMYMAFTAFSFIFTVEISAFIQVLQSKLETLKLNDKDVYQQYADTMKLIRDYNKIFSGQIYLEISMSAIQPCGFGYLLIKSINRYDFRTADLIYKFMIAIVSPFILCAWGQNISTQLDKLHYSSYMCNWYEEKPENRRYLVQLMTATLKPPVLGFRQMIVFNYACFATLLQSIYSYLMMVNQFEEVD